jgi:type I restriction-modification system DNA methylase subunit
MNADELRDYILGFIFYKYLSEYCIKNEPLQALSVEPYSAVQIEPL